MTEASADDGKIVCEIDQARVHSIQLHLRDHHPAISIEEYKRLYPSAPLMSARAKATVARKLTEREDAARVAVANKGIVTRPFHELFGLGTAKAALNAKGGPIMISCFEEPDEQALPYLAPVNPNYVFDIELTKTVLIGLEKLMPTYLWGFHGTGKTTNLQQIHARTKRPFMRVQHTVNMEEAHVVGQYVVQDGGTHWQPGPLMDAMLYGYTYCADEYDRATAPVLSLYQAVLEGEPLVTKEAPPAYRVIKPHPNFRFVATGNTNGCGDETGLYQGTQMQDAANYSRFQITMQVNYMEPKVETLVVAGQAGVDVLDAGKLVEFANNVRQNFAAGKIGATISPRELISAAKMARYQGSNFRAGIRTAFANRLSKVDREVVDSFAQRCFG
jgi:cobaltochelatase CobS